jgi:hypothetical protein
MADKTRVLILGGGSIGRWTFSSQKISSSFSINARWPHRKLKPARRRGLAIQLSEPAKNNDCIAA